MTTEPLVKKEELRRPVTASEHRQGVIDGARVLPRSRPSYAPGSLDKAADDEPVFVLRAKDVLAPEVVEYWARLAKERGSPTAKVEDALQVVRMMRNWGTTHGTKVPD